MLRALTVLSSLVMVTAVQSQDYGAWRLSESKDKFDAGMYSCIVLAPTLPLYFAFKPSDRDALFVVIKAGSSLKYDVIRQRRSILTACEARKYLGQENYCPNGQRTFESLKIEYIINDGTLKRGNMSMRMDSDNEPTFSVELDKAISGTAALDYRILLDASLHGGKGEVELDRGSVSVPSPADAHAAVLECDRKVQANRPR